MNDMTLQQQYSAAAEKVATLKSRNVDAATLENAVREALNLKDRLAREQNDASVNAEIARLTGHSNGGGVGRWGQSLGQQVTESEAWKWVLERRGNLPTAQWTSPSSELKATTIDSGTASGGDLIVTDYQAGIVPLPLRRLVVADLIRPGTTTSNTVGYMAETTATNAAATVAEGQPKPESTLVFDAVTDPVRKIPTWLPVTEEMLEDVPQMRSYIDARLRLFVNLALDDELLNGALDTAPHITGFRNRTGLATSITRTGSVTNADAVLRQITAIETATNLPVDGIVMNPTNWETILLSKDGNGQYYGGGPFATPQRPLLWGRPVATTSAMPVNEALVGAFQTGAQLFFKGNLRVEASNAHSDFFVRNLVAIRAELRAALATYRISAFGKVLSLT